MHGKLWLAGAWLAAGLLTAELSGEPAAAPLKIHIISGSKSYKSEASLREFKSFLEERYRVECSASWAQDGAKKLDNLEALPAAELLIVFARRMDLPEEQMTVIRQHWEKGKPIIGIRTASHAFQPADNRVFIQQVLGGNYTGYGGKEFPVANSEKEKAHPVLKGVEPFSSHLMYGGGKLAADAIMLQSGTNNNPVTWVHSHKGGRTFYTSLGVPEDFKNEHFRRLLTNAVFWTSQRDPENMKK
jgi:type 1 glutamine amidotransferase